MAHLSLATASISPALHSVDFGPRPHLASSRSADPAPPAAHLSPGHHPEADHEEVRRIRAARQQVEAAERRVRAMQAAIVGIGPDSQSLGTLLAELHRLERSVFSRRLELDDLLRHRRRTLPSMTTASVS